MVRMEGRVNLRLAAETLEPYERLAAALGRVGMPTTVTQLIRQMVEVQVEQVSYVCEYVDRAASGDKEAAAAVFGKLVDWNQAYLNLAREAETKAEYPEKAVG
jgi:predicted DNA-binding protein